jgi:hypothetical protein
MVDRPHARAGMRVLDEFLGCGEVHTLEAVDDSPHVLIYMCGYKGSVGDERIYADVEDAIEHTGAVGGFLVDGLTVVP